MTGEPFQGYARHSYPRMGVEIGLRQGNAFWNFNPEVTTVEEFETGPLPAVIPLDAARALYEALGEVLGFAPVNAQTIRSDLLHERRRVDKFIDHMIKDAERE